MPQEVFDVFACFTLDFDEEIGLPVNGGERDG